MKIQVLGTGCAKCKQLTCGYRPKPISDSGASRSPIPVEADH